MVDNRLFLYIFLVSASVVCLLIDGSVDQWRFFFDFILFSFRFRSLGTDRWRWSSASNEEKKKGGVNRNWRQRKKNWKKQRIFEKKMEKKWRKTGKTKQKRSNQKKNKKKGSRAVVSVRKWRGRVASSRTSGIVSILFFVFFSFLEFSGFLFSFLFFARGFFGRFLVSASTSFHGWPGFLRRFFGGVWPGLTGFYWVLLFYFRFDWVWLFYFRFDRVWLGLTGFDWV